MARREKPNGYWKEDENIKTEIRAFVEKHGPDNFSEMKIKSCGESMLALALTKRGIRFWREEMGLPNVQKGQRKAITFQGIDYPSVKSATEALGISKHTLRTWINNGQTEKKSKPNGFYTKEKCLEVGREILKRRGDISQEILSKEKKSTMNTKIGEHFGGMKAFKEELGLTGQYYSMNEEIAMEIARDLLSKYGEKAINNNWCRRNKEYSFMNAAQRYLGGMPGARERLNLSRNSNSIEYKAEILGVDLSELFESIRSVQDCLGNSSQYLLVSQAKAVKDLAANSPLRKVVKALATGQVSMKDLARDDSGNSTFDQLTKQAIDEYRGEEVGEEDTKQWQVEDDSEERKAQFLTVRPAERMKAVGIMASNISDEECAKLLALIQKKATWDTIYHLENQGKFQEIYDMMDELAGQPSGNLFESTWQKDLTDEWNHVLDIHHNGIQGLNLNGKRLHLFQCREAYLLARDKRRFNFSTTGAGKTLCGIAGALLMGAERVLILSPNRQVKGWVRELKKWTDITAIETQTWTPRRKTQWVINNKEMVVDNKAAARMEFLDDFEPDLIIVDEAHQFKGNGSSAKTQKRKGLADFANNKGAFYGMTATPLTNKNAEIVDLLNALIPAAAIGLEGGDNPHDIMMSHLAIQPHSTRYVGPKPFTTSPNILEVNADQSLDEVRSLAGRKGAYQFVDPLLAQGKINKAVELAKRPGKLVIYTWHRENLVPDLCAALEANGVACAVYNGEIKDYRGKDSIDAFIEDEDVQVLIASIQTTATGVDGLQYVCNRMCFLQLPWTDADYEQAVGRINRQGQTMPVEISVLDAQVFVPDQNESFSIDAIKMNKVSVKRTISAGVLDGVPVDQDALISTTWAVDSALKKLAVRNS